MSRMCKKTISPDDLRVPAAHDWRTTDEDEINKRRLRARTENLRVTNTDSAHPVFSTFRVKSPSGLTYSVEIRDLRQRQFACDCVDFRCNGLGTCKHVEATLHLLERRHGKLYRDGLREGSRRIDLVMDRGADTLRIERGADRLPKALQP